MINPGKKNLYIKLNIKKCLASKNRVLFLAETLFSIVNTMVIKSLCDFWHLFMFLEDIFNDFFLTTLTLLHNAIWGKLWELRGLNSEY